MNIEGKFKYRENKEEILVELRTALDNSLKELTDTLDNYGIPYALDSGSLLGAVRNGKSLTGDSDHDIAIKIEDLCTEQGRRFLKERATNFKRCEHSSRTYDKQKIKLFDSAESLLEKIESGKPFSPVNLGYETLYDGRPHRFLTHNRRAPLKIDVFILYPWERIGIVSGNDLPEHNNSYVYILPFHGVHYCKLDKSYLDFCDVEMQLETFNEDRTAPGKPKLNILSGYSNTTHYLESLYGDWRTPSKSYNWFSRNKFKTTKIWADELYNIFCTNTAEIQETYLYSPIVD